jgi:hypothetical protein
LKPSRIGQHRRFCIVRISLIEPDAGARGYGDREANQRRVRPKFYVSHESFTSW